MRVSVHHHLDVLVLRSESLHTDVLESAVGSNLARLIYLRAPEHLFHKVRVRIFSLLHVGVDELVHLRPDHFVSDFVILRHRLFQGILSVAGRPSLILVLEYK